jgi:L-ascorbate metabolism protein UlaG (beta-lactamase superfamily)
MKIKWLGHASFLITAANGVKVITDPYQTGSGIDYGEIEESADVVVVSHGHADHSNVGAVKGSPVTVSGSGSKVVEGIEIKGVGAFHDEDQGSQRGENTVFTITVDGMKVGFLGDLGHVLTNEQVAQIGVVDVLLAPVGGTYTIDAANAERVCDALKPRVIIPMHFKTEKCGYPIAGVEPFLQGKKGVRRVGSSEADFTKETLPATSEIVVLEHAL